MTKPKLPPGENHNYNVRDAKGRFVKVGVGIVATCQSCGKLFNTIKSRLIENGGLCGMCFHTQA